MRTVGSSRFKLQAMGAIAEGRVKDAKVYWRMAAAEELRHLQGIQRAKTVRDYMEPIACLVMAGVPTLSKDRLYEIMERLLSDITRDQEKTKPK